MAKEKFVVGWSSYAVNTHLLARIEAPSNWKDEKKIAEYVDKKEQERDESAKLLPIIGQVSEIVVVDAEGNKAFHACRPDGDPNIARLFLEFVLRHESYGGGDIHIADREDVTTFFGFNAKPLFRIVAMEVMAKYPEHARVMPPRFWYNVPGVYDPYEMLVQNDMRSSVDLPALCEFLKIDPDLSTATSRAYTAHLICHKAGLLNG